MSEYAEATASALPRQRLIFSDARERCQSPINHSPLIPRRAIATPSASSGATSWADAESAGVQVAGFGIVTAAEIVPFGTRHEDLAEVDAADAVVSVTVEVDQRAGEPVGWNSIHGVADDDGMLQANIFDDVGIADGGGDATSADVGLAAEDGDWSVDLILRDSRADYRQ